MRKEAEQIAFSAIKAALPYENTKKILRGLSLEGNITVEAIGKAAIPMAKAAEDVLGDKIKKGLIVTKYNHAENFSSSYFEVIESGHPISDENSILAAEKGLEIASSLSENDILLVLLSGGGSALFEKSKISPVEQREITKKLLSNAADIREINSIRKRLSLVKGGLLAQAAYPAKVITIALSDVLSNDKSVIASGITVKDSESEDFVRDIFNKYVKSASEQAKEAIFSSREIKINDGGYYFAGDINILCDYAGKKAEELGFTVHQMERDLSGEARDEAVRIIDSIPSEKGKHCYIFGGETVVTIKGDGKGGRNQETALSAAIKLRDKKGICLLSIGSDGTDGPTDAAGGFANGNTYNKMLSLGISPEKELDNNNSYSALYESGYVLKTGATGTNVNDLIIILTENYEN